MKIKFGFALLTALTLSACASSSGPKPKERAIQVSNIKPQLAVEYMRGQNYRQTTERVSKRRLGPIPKMTLLGWYAPRFISI